MATVLASSKQVLTSSSTVAAVSASPSRLLQGKALSTVSTVGYPTRSHQSCPRYTLVHPGPIPTLIVDVPATTKVAYDLTPSQVTVEVLGTKQGGLAEAALPISMQELAYVHLPSTYHLPRDIIHW